MKIATILFTYNRSEHTRRVLESLKNNTILPSKLYIFQDGIKDSTDIIEWEKVRKIIKEVDWCETQIHISEINRGVAASEISGITPARGVAETKRRKGGYSSSSSNNLSLGSIK